MIDKRSGLVWQRCVLGQTWTGSTCEGSGTSYYTTDALRMAKAANPTDSPAGWRVPNLRELESLVERGCPSPAIDTAAFPSTPGAPTNTSTPGLSVYSRSWYIDFASGALITDSFLYGSLFPVRLVRSAY